uniref:Cytochrome P450 n=1 Tax=Lotus japonicus TaxID=34305 RepID=I3SYF5_LOTJA|nr:unknown [Lotus japonicus]
MESQSYFLVITSLIFTLLWLAQIYKQKIKVTSTAVHKLPPGPWKLPLIGNLHQMAAAGSLPHHSLRELANKYGPLMHLQLGESSTVVVSSPDMAKEIMKTHGLAFAQRPELLSPKILAYGSTDIAFAPYGDYWRQMRKICTLELLSAKRVQSFSFIREDEVAKLIQSIHLSASAGSPFNLSKSVFSLVNTFLSRVVFGKKSECEDELLSLIKKAVELTAGFDVAELFPSFKPLHLITRMEAKLENMHKKLDKIFDSIVNEHQSDHGKGENLVDVLLRMQHSGNLYIPITVNNIKAVIWDIIAAGTDTSATALEWAMAELMKNPRVREKAQAELREAFKGKKTINETDLCKLSYLKSVIKETLRLHPPAPLLVPRECREACKIGGYEIPVKTKVIVNAWALGRDPNHWYDAEKFIPERFHETSVDFKGNNFEYIPFGAGRRICPGILLGLANIELPLAAFLYHFDWALPNGMKSEDLDMIETWSCSREEK